MSKNTGAKATVIACLFLIAVVLAILLLRGLSPSSTWGDVPLTILSTTIVGVSIVYHLFYRAISEGRFSSFAIASLLAAWVQGITIAISYAAIFEEARSQQAHLLRWILVSVFVLSVMGLIQLFMALQRRTETLERVEFVLEKIAVPGAEAATIAPYRRLARLLVREDYYPNSLPQCWVDAKHKERAALLDVLPSALFNKGDVTPNDLLVVDADRNKYPGRSQRGDFKRTVDGTWHAFVSIVCTASSYAAILWYSYLAVSLR